jgi:O-succinylbenzoate synthase
MNLEHIELYHLSMPLRSPFETSFGRSLNRDCILIRMLSEGVEGWGECVADRDPGYSYETTGTAWHVLVDFLIPLLRSAALPAPGQVRAALAKVRGHQMAKAGLEMALWDLHGKLENRSLGEMLGGTRQRVEVGVSVGIQASPQELVRTVEGYLSQGYARIKIKIKPGRDIAETQAVRHAFPHIRLQVDANSAYTLSNSGLLKPLDDLDLLLIEQPLSEDDLWEHHHLQAMLKTPLCLDESILSERHARQALEMEACRIINIKAGRVGGLSEAAAIHHLCYEQDVPVWCGGMLETGVGRASNLALASLPGFTLPADISATDRYYAEDITEEVFSLNAGSTIDVPPGPGLGVSINASALHKFTVRHWAAE